MAAMSIRPAHPPHEPLPLVLIGGGGHALVVAEAAHLAQLPIAGFLDDNPAAPLAAILIDLPHPFPVPAHLGTLEATHQLTGRHWIIATGDLAHRRSMLRALGTGRELIHSARAVIHPTAYISPSAVVGAGAFVGPKCVVQARARIGAHAIINSGAIVEHDCVIEENAHIAPGAALGGGVHVGHDTLVGLGARVLPLVRIGAGCVVGSGAVVTQHVSDHAKVVGVPARVLKKRA
jgi:UDP-perosamine 4-acetyltransferase